MLQKLCDNLNSAQGFKISDNQFEAIQDALSGLNMGEIAYTQWLQSWLVQSRWGREHS